MLKLQDEIPDGILDLVKSKEEQPKSIQIAVHYGKFEEIYAMASIEIQDLKELVLKSCLKKKKIFKDLIPIFKHLLSPECKCLYCHSM